MDVPELADQQILIKISSIRTVDVVWKTCKERWMIETNGYIFFSFYPVMGFLYKSKAPTKINRTSSDLMDKTFYL